MNYSVYHRTHYNYQSAVRDSFNELRLVPASSEDQTVATAELQVAPATRLQQYRDFYFNTVHHFELIEPHQQLCIESRLAVRTHPRPRLDPTARVGSVHELKKVMEPEQLHDFVLPSQYVDTAPESWRLAIDTTHGETDVWQNAQQLMRFVNGHLSYQSQSTNVHTHMREVLAQRRGVCQDFAHVLIGLCRCLQIPARYVSGYLATETASATHAWTEVYMPSHGWQPLDPTHNSQTDATYIKIAIGRDYADVAPVRGTYRGTTTRQMQVEVRIEPQNEAAPLLPH